jgi:hypothetical protein
MISKILDHPTGRIIISILLGLGLATLFRKACTGNNCIVVTGPKASDVQKHYYKVDDDCFKYTPYQVSCEVPQVAKPAL